MRKSVTYRTKEEKLELELHAGSVRITVDDRKVLVFDHENGLKNKAHLTAFRNLLYRKFEDVIEALDSLTRGA